MPNNGNMIRLYVSAKYILLDFTGQGTRATLSSRSPSPLYKLSTGKKSKKKRDAKKSNTCSFLKQHV